MKPIFSLDKSGSVFYEPNTGTTIWFDILETEKMLHCELKTNKIDWKPILWHINITNFCNRNCSGCYVDKNNDIMSLDNVKKVVDMAVENKVHSITFGGGEPLTYPNLDELVDYTYKSINVCITTNGDILKSAKKNTLKKFRQINISYHDNIKELKENLEYLVSINVKTGINFVYYTPTISIVDEVAKIAKDTGSELLLLQYKPVVEDSWKDYISPEIAFAKAKELSKSGIDIAIDGACCGQCKGMERFATIAVNGDVQPCSFVKKPYGNIFKQSFKNIWKSRGEMIPCPYIKNYDRSFRGLINV